MAWSASCCSRRSSAPDGSRRKPPACSSSMPGRSAIAWTNTASSARMALTWKAMRKTEKRMSERAIEVPAPGKINLILRVLDRRPDGYHNVWSVMQTLDLTDTIVLEEDSKKPGITLSCEGATL